MSIIGVLGCFITLFLGSISDLRRKAVPLYLLIAGNVGGLFCCLYRHFENITNVLCITEQSLFIELAGSIMPGLGLLILSFVTGRKIGVGDGFILLSVGMFESGKMAWSVLCFGLFLQSVCAILLLILKKAKRDTKIPFVPFLLAGRTVMYFI